MSRDDADEGAAHWISVARRDPTGANESVWGEAQILYRFGHTNISWG
ncbi:hypothetical protein [Paraburkholderia sp.]